MLQIWRTWVCKADGEIYWSSAKCSPSVKLPQNIVGDSSLFNRFKYTKYTIMRYSHICSVNSKEELVLSNKPTDTDLCLFSIYGLINFRFKSSLHTIEMQCSIPSPTYCSWYTPCWNDVTAFLLFFMTLQIRNSSTLFVPSWKRSVHLTHSTFHLPEKMQHLISTDTKTQDWCVPWSRKITVSLKTWPKNVSWV